jgi:hypothetical protein
MYKSGWTMIDKAHTLDPSDPEIQQAWTQKLSRAPAAAREVTKVHGDSSITIKGLSGNVKKVYSADKAILQFGHLRQENQDMVAIDFTRISDNIGTEISGTLGFTLLRFLDIKIDYRDGLVDFEYDRKRWGP